MASAVAWASAQAASRATTVTASGPTVAGAPVRGSIKWCRERFGPKRLALRPDVATAPSSRSRTPTVRSGCRGSATAMRHGPRSGGTPETATSPPRSTSAPRSPSHASRIATSARDAENPLPMPPRSTIAPRSTRTRCASDAISISAPGRQPACGSAGRSSSSSKVRSYPAATRAGRIVGSNFPPVAARARHATRRASTSLASTSTHSPAYRFMRERSLAGSNRLRTRSQDSTSVRPAASASCAFVAAPGRAVTASVQLVPMAGNAARWSRPIIRPAEAKVESSRAGPRRWSSRARRSAASRSCP